MPSEVVLITGASSGIGRELALKFAADGSHLVLVARRTDRLQELADQLQQQHGVTSTVISSDLAQPGAADDLIQQLQQKNLSVDVLINNAGFGQYGDFIEIDRQRHHDMVTVNIDALVQLTQLLLPGMLERKRGAILNVASTAAFQPGPKSAVYYATKAFVLSFSEALWSELRGTGVYVTCLCPGPTHTEFGDESGMTHTLIFRLNSMRADDVAKAAHRGLRKQRRMVMPGVLNNLLAWSVRISPRGTLLQIMRALQSNREPRS